jgi:hypothetical protein
MLCCKILKFSDDKNSSEHDSRVNNSSHAMQIGFGAILAIKSEAFRKSRLRHPQDLRFAYLNPMISGILHSEWWGCWIECNKKAGRSSPSALNWNHSEDSFDPALCGTECHFVPEIAGNLSHFGETGYHAR